MAKQHESSPSSQATAAAVASAWPGGWYVYENGRVEGPMSAEDAFGLAAETADGKPRLVSRKGFSQWYALKDLSEIFRLTDQMGRKAEVARLEMAAAQAAPAPSGAVRPAATTMPAAVTAAPALAHAGAAAQASPAHAGAAADAPEAARAGFVAGVAAPEKAAKTSVPTPTKKSLKNKKSKSLAAPVTEPDAKPLQGPFSATEKKPLPTPSKAERQLTAQALILQEYFLQRGRLRLGKIRNPWITGFIGLPASLGAYWAVWYGDLARELAFHAQAQEPSKADAWLAVIPLVHFFMIFKLAKAVVAMEAQNQYKSVSPAVAVFFGIFPPFALAYLQDAANRHWLLHAKHAYARRRAEEAAS